MSQARFGELLGRLVPLTGHDVDEILEEQAATRHRFGEIALSWGLCEPQHLWQAWCDQLSSRAERIDLDVMGVDAQAAGLIDRTVAHRLGVLPIRVMGDHLIVAMAGEPDPAAAERAAAELSLITGKQIRFVTVADTHQFRRVLAGYHAGGEPMAA